MRIEVITMEINKSRSTFVFVLLTLIGLSVLYLSYFVSQENEIAEIVWWGIKVVAGIIAIWTYILIFYYMFLSVVGYGKAKRDYKEHAPKLKFLIMVPAHNEATVINETIKHLRKIDYPNDLYNIVVVSDESTDSTASISKNMNVDLVDTSLHKHHRFGVGKPAGLQYALEDYDYRQYDYVMVLDADNFVDANVFKELNSQLLEKRFDAVQVYLDSKNANKFQALGYASSYWTMNRAFQLAKYRLNLPNSIGGTGFVVSTEWLANNNGFKSHSLTEDLEMEIRIVESGGKVGWNHFTRIYDEKPEKLKASIVQRYRWSRGHWYVALHNYRQLFKDFLKTGKFRYLDQINYLLSMRENVQMLTALVLFLGGFAVISLFGRISLGFSFLAWSESYVEPVTLFNFFVLFYGFVPMFYGIIVDGKQGIFKAIKAVIALMWFSVTYFLAQISGLFTYYDQGSWAHTKHVQNEIKPE